MPIRGWTDDYIIVKPPLILKAAESNTSPHEIL